MENTEKKKILYGTPKMDGKLDAQYLDSFCFEEKPMENVNYCPTGKEGAEKYMPRTAGKSYYLYDDRYLYVCTVVHDETICTQGKQWRMDTVWPWNDDGAEIYLWFSDEDCMAIHSDAHGYRSVVDEHIWGDHRSAQKYRDLAAEDWGASIDAEQQNYTVEFRIPLPSYVKAGSEIGTLLEIDDRWAVGEGTEDMVGAIYATPRVTNDPRYRVVLAEKDEK